MLAERTFLWWNANEWNSIGVWVTVAVAVVAAIAALRQIKASHDITDEESWPYVAAYMEESAASHVIIDVVVKNFGKTAALDVTLTSNPPLEQTVGNGKSEPLWLPDSIPTLVPGQEWRTLWDVGHQRYESDLPKRHEVTVRFTRHNPRKNEEPFEYQYILDWAALMDRENAIVRGTHDIAGSLKEIQKDVRSWRESATGSLKVYVRDGDAKDARDRKAHDAWQSTRRAERDARTATEPTDQPDDPPNT